MIHKLFVEGIEFHVTYLEESILILVDFFPGRIRSDATVNQKRASCLVEDC